MAGTAKAVKSGAALRDAVAELAESLNLNVEKEVRLGRRVWGARRNIDVVIRNNDTKQSLGIECKYQDSKGSAEEKIPATMQDIPAWPIKGLVVYSGKGFSTNMKAYLLSTGLAIEFNDLKKWLELYFGL